MEDYRKLFWFLKEFSFGVNFDSNLTERDRNAWEKANKTESGRKFMKTKHSVPQHEPEQPKGSSESINTAIKLSTRESVLLEMLKAKMT